MNKYLPIVAKIAFWAVLIFFEEILFYIIFLRNVMTKQSLNMWITFILGSIIISIINIVFVHFISKNVGLKTKSVSFLIISSILACIVLLILSFLYDKDFLEVVDYKKEINYFSILIFSFFIVICTSICTFILKLINKIFYTVGNFPGSIFIQLFVISSN